MDGSGFLSRADCHSRDGYLVGGGRVSGVNAKQVTFHQLDTMLDGYGFTGHELKILAETSVPYNEDHNGQHYPATYLRYMREYRKKTGRRIVCVNKAKSLYKILPS